MTNTTVQPSDVVNGLMEVIEGVLGSAESPATKAHIRAVSAIIGILCNEMMPFFRDKCDLPNLLLGIQRAEEAAMDLAQGVEMIQEALNHKPVPPGPVQATMPQAAAAPVEAQK